MRIDTDGMIWEEEDYPSWEDLPDQTELIDEKDWDVLVVLDACRWDAFEVVTGREAKKVATPAERSTPDWVTQVWCREDMWDDVTYISGNSMTDWIKDADRYGCDLEEHVGEYVRAFEMEDVYDPIVSVSRPDRLTQHVVDEDYDTPMVIHYIQPHTPFIGRLSVQAPTHELEDWMNEPAEGDRVTTVYDLVEGGEVSPKMMRMAYLENLKLVWRKARRLGTKYDTVIYTADHGEALGPDAWDHGGMKDNRARVVPWYER